MDMEIWIIPNGSFLKSNFIKYYIIAGEASGDIYGAQLMEALKANDPNADFRFWGGNKMLAVDSNQAMDYRNTAFMGFWEVIKNLGTIRKNFAFCKKDILEYNPDKIIYIDYPGFNLRMAKWTKERNYHNIYFVAPQIWAWKKNRYKKIKRDIDQLFVILPFEKGFYNGLGIEAMYFGHPLEASIAQKQNNKIEKSSLKIAILPGSRNQELQKHMPVFVELIKSRPQDKFVIALAPGLMESQLTQYISASLSNLEIQNNNHEVLRNADIALVKSGTSTLETALIGTPQIVIYKTSALSYSIAKRIVKLPWISLVNIIAGKKVVTELIQHEFNSSRLNKEIELLIKKENLEIMQDDYTTLRSSLKGDEVFQKVANRIIG